ncbi:MAG TPA: hypothetical protein VE954_18970 [Oligoflexus sp.]|uniref:leucine-rich repeat domain-containing protein n=1 Tax=Oligoflexus sp. TaxID=1971216 RepID=UPI002D27ECA5|nr:hypothetical protein [Oligoflexus sp.]HYX35183.1 hypothetical protein [Oligoflexus sp.]
MNKALIAILGVLMALACQPLKKAGYVFLNVPSGPSAFNLGQAAIDSTLLEARMYKVIDRQSTELKDLPATFPVVILSQKTQDAGGSAVIQTIGFAIDCKGRDPQAVLKAFGDVFLDSDDVEVIAENDLNALFKVAEQPILRCDALVGQNTGLPLFSQVFRVLDQNANKVHHVVRFNASSPRDKQLFELGCSNLLDAFWKETPDRKAIPVLRESFGDIPGSENVGALHCFSSASPLPQNLFLPAHPQSDPDFDARLYRVHDAEQGLMRVLLTQGKAFRLNCSATDGALQEAFGLPSTGSLEIITANDPEFSAVMQGQMAEQPTLRCPSALYPQFASQAYRIINQQANDVQAALRNPVMRLVADEAVLVEFNCESAARFFAPQLLDELAADPERMVPITSESKEYLVRKYVPGQWKARVYSLGCGSEADVRQLPFYKSCLDYLESADDTGETRAVAAYMKAYRQEDVGDNLSTLEKCQRHSAQLMKSASLALPDAGIETLKPFSRLRKLKALIVPGNRLDGVDLEDLNVMSSLQELNLARNNLHDLPSSLGFGSQLISIDLSQNSLSSVLPLKQFTQLAVLNLAENPLESLTGLEALRSTLSYLNLNQTHVFQSKSEESLQQLSLLHQLKFLDVSHSGLSIPSETLASASHWGRKFPGLIYLNVSGNAIQGDVSALRLINNSTATLNNYAALVGLDTDLHNLQAYEAPESQLVVQLPERDDPAAQRLTAALAIPAQFYRVLYREDLKDPFENLALSRQERLSLPALFFDPVAMDCTSDLTLALPDVKALCQMPE